MKSFKSHVFLRHAALQRAQNKAARMSPDAHASAGQQVQSGDKREISRGCWLEPGQIVSGLTSPLTAGDKKRSPSPQSWRHRIH
jgi:hypothetical protein